MVKATFSVLSEADKQLVLEAEPKKLKALDEDQLLDLHARVRRARNRHVKLPPQAGASGFDRARARQQKPPTQLAEVRDLARVSRRLGAAARQRRRRAERRAGAVGQRGPAQDRERQASAAQPRAVSRLQKKRASTRPPASAGATSATAADRLAGAQLG